MKSHEEVDSSLQKGKSEIPIFKIENPKAWTAIQSLPHASSLAFSCYET